MSKEIKDMTASQSHMSAESASAEPSAAWRPIETAPRDGTRILLICSSAHSPEARMGWWRDDGWVCLAPPDHKLPGGIRVWFPTHWLPLPPPPGRAPTPAPAPARELLDLVRWAHPGIAALAEMDSNPTRAEGWRALGNGMLNALAKAASAEALGPDTPSQINTFSQQGED